jgi:hypothetical protein
MSTFLTAGRTATFALLAIAIAACADGGSGSASRTALVPSSSATAVAISSPGTTTSLSTTTSTSFTPGATAFYDNFEEDAVGGSAPLFSVVTGTWNVCQLSGTSHEYCQTSNSAALAMAGNNQWTNYAVDAYVVNPNFSTGMGLLGRVVDTQNFYELELRMNTAGTNQPAWYLWRVTNNSWKELAGGAFTTNANPYYHLELIFMGSSISAYVAYDYTSAYQLLGSATDTTFPAGQIALRTSTKTNGRYDGVEVILAGTPAPSPTPSPSPSPSSAPVNLTIH